MFDFATRTLDALVFAGGQSFFRNNNAQRDAKQVAVGKLFARTRITIVPQHLDASLRQFAVQLGRVGADIGIAVGMPMFGSALS